MSKVTGYACDVCDRFSAKGEGWMEVSRAGEKVDVCGAKCLGKLARQLDTEPENFQHQARANGGSGRGASPNPYGPCPRCDREFPTAQGLAIHLIRTHQTTLKEQFGELAAD